jgi:hypothetical protein
MLHCVTVRAEADRSYPCRAGTTSRITYEDWALVEAENWRQLRPHALEAVAGLLADAERFGEAVGTAQAAVNADPLRESPHAALIAVHLRDGNQSEALALARVGLLVIRAWVEEGSERPLRVEVRLTADSGRGFERELVFSEPKAVERLVRAWLEQLFADGAERPAGRPPRGAG